MDRVQAGENRIWNCPERSNNESEVCRYKVLIATYISLMSGKEETGKLLSGMVKQLENRRVTEVRGWVPCTVCVFTEENDDPFSFDWLCLLCRVKEKRRIENDSAICFICHMT